MGRAARALASVSTRILSVDKVADVLAQAAVAAQGTFILHIPFIPPIL